jgi:hypothetical protein
MKFMDFELARRVETAEMFAARAFAESAQRMHPEATIAVEEIAGGTAVFAGADSPITQAIGLGMHGPVAGTDLDRMTEFFHSRGTAAAAEICPLVDLSLYAELGRRGYRLGEVSNVLVYDLSLDDRGPASSEVVVRPVEPGEVKLWATKVMRGFSEDGPVPDSMRDILESFPGPPDACHFLAFVNGEVAGGATVSVRGGVCGLFGASTLPVFRRRGVQTALLAARLKWARTRGCDLAASITQPGSISHRNMERFGFRVAYTRTKLFRDLASAV